MSIMSKRIIVNEVNISPDGRNRGDIQQHVANVHDAVD